MDHEDPSTIPLPVSTVASPVASPLLRTRKWLPGALHTSPNSSPIPDMDLVPPTPPPRRPRRQVPMTPIEDNEVSLPGSPQQSVVGTPGRRARMMNRLSGAFHEGTPPPATRMLHPDDAKSRYTPISNTFLRDGKRSSIVSNLPSSRRHSVVSAHRDAPWEMGRESRHFDEPPMLEDEDEEEGEQQQHEDMMHQPQQQQMPQTPRRQSRRPGMPHRETTSDETYVSQPGTSDGNWRTSSSTNSHPPVRKPARVDPLTLLERRRRRDYTLGSHHPLHSPPNPPPQGNRRLSEVTDASEEDEEEVPNVEWADIVNRFKTVWRRFGDMPWVADPCVAKLVISHSTTNSSSTPGEKKSEEPPIVPWYRPKPTLDEILADEAAREGAEPDGDNDSTTLAHYGPVPNSTNSAKPTSKWFPRMPQASHQPGRERFGASLVERGLVRRE